jgi:hypothetical protein
MSGDIGTIAAKMDSMNNDITQVTGDVIRMTDTFIAMDAAVYGIGREVNVMSAPMKTFNSLFNMFPFP